MVTTTQNSNASRLDLAPVFVSSAAYAAARTGSGVETTPARATGFSGLALLFLWLGSISIGGRSEPYVFDEIVRRRGWVSEADYQEGYVLGKILPGPTGVGTSLFCARLLCGMRRAAALELAFVLPGALAALGLSILLFGFSRPAWLDGALVGSSGAALAIVVAKGLRLGGSGRAARYWPLFTGLAFVAYGPLNIGLLPLVVGLFPLSLLVNRPRATRS